MSKINREQKYITKKLVEFHNQFVLLTVDKRELTGVRV